MYLKVVQQIEMSPSKEYTYTKPQKTPCSQMQVSEYMSSSMTVGILREEHSVHEVDEAEVHFPNSSL